MFPEESTGFADGCESKAKLKNRLRNIIKTTTETKMKLEYD